MSQWPEKILYSAFWINEIICDSLAFFFFVRSGYESLWFYGFCKRFCFSNKPLLNFHLLAKAVVAWTTNRANFYLKAGAIRFYVSFISGNWKNCSESWRMKGQTHGRTVCTILENINNGSVTTLWSHSLDWHQNTWRWVRAGLCAMFVLFWMLVVLEYLCSYGNTLWG